MSVVSMLDEWLLMGGYLMDLVVQGPLYADIRQNDGTDWGKEDREVVEATVKRLLTTDTTLSHPGVLLGKVQSGKTRAFLGIIALALDNGYDLAVILTKGTRALARQTFQRVDSVFKGRVENHEVRVFDIMEIPQNLAPAELRYKIVLVVKKEDDNLRRLQSFLFDEYPELQQKRILMVDDEADLASIGFRKFRGGSVEPAVLMTLINQLRSRLKRLSYLQVTATPYSLYLQPDDKVLSENGLTMPTRPAFTELIHVHDRYVGGEVYFEESQEADSVASFLFVPVTDGELTALRKPDGRRLKLDDVLVSERCARLRQAVVGFVVGAALGRLRSMAESERPKNYSLVIHTDPKKGAHEWQSNVVRHLIDDLRTTGSRDDPLFETLMRSSYLSFVASIQANGQQVAPYESVLPEARDCLDSIAVDIVNSERKLESLLDQRGQLHLRNKLNVFIGGQILDRGLTIENMIGFYYGRSPASFQQDTVLQHSRMYGPRDRRDLPITRFYTSARIHEVMRMIHEMDSALRQQIEVGGHNGGVVFIQRRDQKIVPCNPNKVLRSVIITYSSGKKGLRTILTILAPGKKLIPVGFQTLSKTRLAPHTARIDDMVARHIPPDKDRVTADISVEDALRILGEVVPTLQWSGDDEAYRWDSGAFMCALEYTAQQFGNGRVLLFVRRGADSARTRPSGRFQNSPETGEREVELTAARRGADPRPLLVLLRHSGAENAGWSGAPFWWPMLYAPRSMSPVLYCADGYVSEE